MLFGLRFALFRSTPVHPPGVVWYGGCNFDLGWVLTAVTTAYPPRFSVPATWVLPHLGQAKLRELDSRAVAAWRASILPAAGEKPERGVTATAWQANHALRALSALCGYAVQDGYLAANPCSSVRRVRTLVRAPRVLTPEEIELRVAMPTLRDAVLVSLALAGLRPSEAFALRWGAEIGRATSELQSPQ